MRIYIASRLENVRQVREVRDALVRAGHSITYDWTIHGSVQSDGMERVTQVAVLECNGVHKADIVLVLLPGGRGTHTELGMAISCGKEIIIMASYEDAHTLFHPGPGGNICAFYAFPSVRLVRYSPETVVASAVEAVSELVASRWSSQ